MKPEENLFLSTLGASGQVSFPEACLAGVLRCRSVPGSVGVCSADSCSGLLLAFDLVISELLCVTHTLSFFQVITNLVKMLKSRDTRRNFCPPNHWLSEQEDIKADKVLLKFLVNVFV